MSFRDTKILRGAAAIAFLPLLLLTAAQPALAQTETVLYSFGGYSGDGNNPYAGLVMDKKGNLYGTTAWGGAYTNGSVFKVTPAGEESVLYSFGDFPDGGEPLAGLIMDKDGNLYGTTCCVGAYWEGTVFKVTPSGEETVLYSFEGGQSGDGGYPLGGLIMDKEGNLYGTTSFGGTSTNCAGGCGTVFKVTPTETETLLYSFEGSASGDGEDPQAGLIMDKKGNFYGTTFEGGAYDEGTVFKVASSGKETVLYSFGPNTQTATAPWRG